MIGIYKIENKVDGKLYIGRSIDIKTRWKRHVINLKAGRHCNKSLQQAWDEYGEDSFKFIPLQECNVEELCDMELCTISEADSELLYNSDRPTVLGRLGKVGFKHSEETKRKLSVAQTEYCKEHGNQFRGEHTQETKDLISTNTKAAMNNPETRKKVSDGNKRRFEDPEQRRKTGERSKIAMSNQDTRDKIAATLRAKPLVSKDCTICGASFESKSPKSLVCSHSCKLTDRRLKRQAKAK
jgi:group I intron endonuclease